MKFPAHLFGKILFCLDNLKLYQFSLSEYYKTFITQFDNEVEEWALRKWFGYVYVIMGIIKSKQRQVDCDRFHGFCFEAMVLLKTFFPWANISYAVHETMGHIADLMKWFGGTGLGHLSEVRLKFCTSICKIVMALCSRNFQNLKLRLQSLRIIQFTATQIFREIKLQKI